MILRRLTKHVNDQNWFAVALDFVIVVIGVGVALMGQQWIANGQERADMAVAMDAIQDDLYYNYTYAKERLAISKCRADAYQAIATQLLEPGEAWAGLPRNDESNTFGLVLPNLLRSPSRNWGSRAWDAGLARGLFNKMDEERRATLDSIFTQTKRAQGLQADIYTLQGRINTLAVSTQMSRSDRLRYYDMLGELDIKSALSEIISGQIVASIERFGIDVPVEYRSELPDDLSQDNDRGKAVYGDCFVPMIWPVFDKYRTSAAAE